MRKAPPCALWQREGRAVGDARLYGFAIFETLLIASASAAAFLQAWGIFAGLAFWSVMLPLWVIAISAAAHHLTPPAAQEGGDA